MQASLTQEGGISIRPIKWDRKMYAKELSENRETMAMGVSVIEELRRGARY